MAEELRAKARTENNDYTKSEFELVAQIYSLLAQRAQMLVDSDAKGLQQQVLEHFAPPAGLATAF